jgi:hypothetical protein
MQTKSAATTFEAQAGARLNSFLLQIPVLICAAVVASILVAKLEAVGYAASGAVQPDPELVYQTMIESP